MLVYYLRPSGGSSASARVQLAAYTRENVLRPESQVEAREPTNTGSDELLALPSAVS